MGQDTWDEDDDDNDKDDTLKITLNYEPRGLDFLKSVINSLYDLE